VCKYFWGVQPSVLRSVFMAFYSTDLRVSKDSEPAVMKREIKQPTRYRLHGKRLFDLFLVVATAPLTIPVIAVLSLAIMVTGQSPFYTQRRIGMGGKEFKIWKLQTMLPNADERLEVYLADNPEARAEWDSKQKLAKDPRVTPLGNYLRRSSLDELPQLFNVFNGSMSLIGPRPMMVCQKKDYYGEAYYRLRPGMSGFWQISKRNNSNFIARVRYDDLYDKQVSLGTDIGVLFQTVAVVIKGTGV